MMKSQWVVGKVAHLIATRTRTEILVGEIEFLDTKRAGLFLLIVDELILLYA